MIDSDSNRFQGLDPFEWQLRGYEFVGGYDRRGSGRGVGSDPNLSHLQIGN